MRLPVVLVHGIDDTGRVFGAMGRALREAGWDVRVVDYTPSNGAVGIDCLPEQMREYVETHFGAGEQFDLVGFSLGGLVSRYYVQKLGGWERVRRLVTISSPHNGTLTAFFRRNAAARQMRPGSAFLAALNDDLEWTRRVEWTSIWTPFDLMILPAHSSRVRQAENRRIRVLMHPLMLTDRRVIRLVQEILGRPPGHQDPPSLLGALEPSDPVKPVSIQEPSDAPIVPADAPEDALSCVEETRSERRR